MTLTLLNLKLINVEPLGNRKRRVTYSFEDCRFLGITEIDTVEVEADGVIIMERKYVMYGVEADQIRDILRQTYGW